MAGQSRQPTDDLAAVRGELFTRLAREPYKFDFFQVLRRLECLAPEKPRIGLSRNPEEDPIRLGQVASAAFAPSVLTSFEDGDDGQPPRMEVAFFGLLGPNGPLPLHLTNHARSRREDGDLAFGRFLDLFNHRMLCLFYRAWAAANPAVNFDRYETDRRFRREDSDRFAQHVAALCGIGMPALRDRDAFPDLAKLFYAGRFACQTSNAEGLEAIVSAHFPLEETADEQQPCVRIEEFVGQWVRLPKHVQLRIETKPGIGRLGETSTIGDAVWDLQQKFRIVVGPIRLRDYYRFLPGGSRLVCLAALVRNYVGDELDWELKLVLHKDEVPACRLGEGDSWLGWTSWLGVDHGAERHAEDLSVSAADNEREWPVGADRPPLD